MHGGGVWRGGVWRGGVWKGGVWRGGVWRGGLLLRISDVRRGAGTLQVPRQLSSDMVQKLAYGVSGSASLEDFLLASGVAGTGRVGYGKGWYGEGWVW